MAAAALAPLGLAAAAHAAPTTGELRYYKFEDDKINDRAIARVNVASGDLVIREGDLHIAGTGLDLQVDRYFNSLTATDTTDLGKGFTLGLGKDVRLDVLADGSVDLHGPSNYVVRFTRNATTGAFATPPGVDGEMVPNADGTYTLTYDADGEQLHFSSTGQLTTDQDANGNKISFAYSPGGLLSSITDTQGRAITVTSDGSGRITAITDPTGRKEQYGYDSNGRLTQFTDAAGTPTKYDYDASGNLTRLTHPSGRVTEFTYDASRRVLSVRRLKDTQTGASATTSFAYSATQTVVTDPNGRDTTYTIDTQGRVSKITDALTHSRTLDYNSDFNVLDQGNAAGVHTISTFVGRDLTKLQLPKSSPTSTATGAATVIAYDAHRVRSVTDAQDNVLTYGYDGTGRNMVTVRDKNAVLRAALDYNGMTAARSCTRITVDTGPKGTVRCSRDGNGNDTIYRYDAKGNLTSEEPPPPLANTTFTYDALSRVSTVTDGKGQKTTFSYDPLDRITQAAFGDGSKVSFTYDPDGNVTSRTDAAGASTFSFDTLNRRIKDQLPDNVTNSYAYDDVGNLTSLTNAGGTVTYHYNAVNLLDTLTEPGGAATTFGYDVNNHRTRTTYPNGVVQTQGYDDAERLKTMAAENAAGTTLTSFTYGFTDATAGHERELVHTENRTVARPGTTALNESITYSYDVLGRLTSASATPANQDIDYEYDGAGNMTGRFPAFFNAHCFTYNAANEVATGSTNCPSAGSPFAYDANGNLTSKFNGLQTLAYNAKNQTTSWAQTGTNPAQLNFAYLGADQFHRTVAGGSTFINTILGLSTETTAAGLTSYVRDADGRLIAERTPTATYYYLYDGHPGSVVGIADASGDVAESYTFQPFGTQWQGGGFDFNINPFRFAGQYLDQASGLYKIGARYYDPDNGHWTQQDPFVGFADPRDANRYVYAADDPINHTDPSGLAVSVCKTIGIGLDAVGVVHRVGGFVALGFGQPQVAGPLEAIGLAFNVAGAALEGAHLATGC